MSKLSITRVRRIQARAKKKAAAIALVDSSTDLEKARSYLAVNKLRHAMPVNEASVALKVAPGSVLAGPLRRRA